MSASLPRAGGWAAIAQRQLTLAAVALLAGVVSLAARDRHDSAAARPSLPASVPAPGGGWYSQLAAASRRSAGRRTACGHVLTAHSVGVAHPVLPCDIKLFVGFGDTTVLTQVVDRGPYVPGRQFELTPELAKLLGVTGTQRIRWRYAGS